MEWIAKTEGELKVITWWKNLDKETKNLVTKMEYGCKRSYKKLNNAQIRFLYKRWN